MGGRKVDIRPANWDDSTYVHASAISFNLKWLLAAHGTLLIHGNGASRVCFAQGVLPGVTQATAALLGEQDIVRMVLQEHGIPTPAAQVHHLADGVDSIVRAAEAWGLPLLVRPVAVSSTAPAPLRAVLVRDRAAARETISNFYSGAGRRAGRRALPQGRLMLERPAGTTDLHVLVIDRGIAAVTASALTSSGGRSYSPIEADAVRHALLPTVRAIAAAFPGLPAAAVHLAVKGGLPDELDRHTVTAVEIYPRFALHERGDPGTGLRLAAIVLQRAVGHELGEVSHAVRECHIRIAGLSGSQTVLRVLGESLAEHGLHGAVRAAAADAATVAAEVRGTPTSLASFARSLFRNGGLPRPLYVEAV